MFDHAGETISLIESWKRPSRREIRELEKKYGKHKFCYQCGNPNIVYEGSVEGYSCPKCGSSDGDE